jgi:Xaa-Pro aminopeptidase
MGAANRPQTGRLQKALRDLRVDAVLLSSPPAVADASGYFPRWETWPGYNPYVPEPALAVAGPDAEPVLILPDYYAGYANDLSTAVALFPSYSHTQPLDQVREQAQAVVQRLGRSVGRLGYERRTLPVALHDEIDARVDVGEWTDVAAALERSRVVKLPVEVEGLREAARMADVVQATVKERAEPGRREIEVANDAIGAAWAEAGERFPILIQLSAGAATAAMGGGDPGQRRLERGDLVCTDTAPWLTGFWSDTCNAVAVGTPDARQREIFEVVAEALRAGIAAARPGAEARAVDDACRSVVRAAGFDYPHHSGHGLGLAHTEPPRITPDSTELVETGMALALEPGVYIEEWGGFRHEHVFVVGADENEVLTQFEHTL